VTPNLCEFRRIISADIKGFGSLLFGKSVEADGEDHYLTRATRGFEEAFRISIKAGGGICREIANVFPIIVIRGTTARGVIDVRIGKCTTIEFAQDFFGINAKVDPEMIYEMNGASLINTREKSELRIGWSATN